MILREVIAEEKEEEKPAEAKDDLLSTIKEDEENLNENEPLDTLNAKNSIKDISMMSEGKSESILKDDKSQLSESKSKIDGSTAPKDDSKSDVKLESKIEPEEVDPVEEYEKVLNPDFTDNPMYPFIVHEPTSICITLYQIDRRWAMGRLGDKPRDMAAISYMNRNDRLSACMKYPTGMGFAVARLFGLKMRLTEFKLRKIIKYSPSVDFSNSVSEIIDLLPGRYCIIPYTNISLDKSTEYSLSCQFKPGTLDFEIEDVLEQRLMDEFPSDDDSEDEEDDDNKSKGSVPMKVPLDIQDPPPQLKYQDWEYYENTEELGVVSLYKEVADISKLLNFLKNEIRDIRAELDVKNTKDNERSASRGTSSPTQSRNMRRTLGSPMESKRGGSSPTKTTKK